jgi:hypothetical protein
MKRILSSLLLMFALPFLVAQNRSLGSATPFASVVLAGHTMGGSWCECGTASCICDSGEIKGLQLTPTSTQPVDEKTVDPTSASDQALSSGMMALALALLLWFRMRR